MATYELEQHIRSGCRWAIAATQQVVAVARDKLEQMEALLEDFLAVSNLVVALKNDNYGNKK